MKKWMVLFGLFQAGDTASTVYATQFLGFQELNPLMAATLGVHPLMFVGVKALATGIILAAAYRNSHRVSTLRMMQVSTVLMGIVVLWNIAGVFLHVA